MIKNILDGLIAWTDLMRKGNKLRNTRNGTSQIVNCYFHMWMTQYDISVRVKKFVGR
jgi:hypothetical protein